MKITPLRERDLRQPGAAVYDAKNSLMDEWHKRNPDNVVILAGDLLTTGNFPAINAMSQTNPNTEMLAGQLIVAQERVATCRPSSRLTSRSMAY
jgi:hypothetical protein